MSEQYPIVIGPNAIEALLAFCQARGETRVFLVADERTYPLLGQRMGTQLQAAGIDVKAIVLHGEEIVADEAALAQVFIQAGGEERLYLAVGSGTLHDITRFVSHRSRCDFVSVPTAPSVDGFMSIGAPLVVGRLKETVICQPPLAVFADIATLSEAPAEMIAAGFGDLMGKFTSITDWKLGHLLWDEPFDEAIFERSLRAAQATMLHAAGIAARNEEAIRHLFAGLIESGFCMVEFGSSRPASGSEHHFSHLWEMKLLMEGRTALLHGAKVGVGTILTARRYEQIQAISQDEIAKRLASLRLPLRESAIAEIRAAYGPIAEGVMKAQRRFLELDAGSFKVLKERIIEQWPLVLDLAESLPSAEQFREWLSAAGGPTQLQPMGISTAEIEMALHHAHYFRERFTVSKLAYYLNLPLPDIT